MLTNFQKRMMSIMEIPLPKESNYVVHERSFHYKKKTKNGEELVNLCNFSARIVEEIIEEDDSGLHRYIVIEGELETKEKLPRVKLSMSEFAKMNWIDEKWGAQAIIEPGTKAKEHIVAALKHLSGLYPIKKVYTSTGWRKINDDWVYVSNNKVISRQGETTVVSGMFEEKELSNYQLENPSAESVEADIRTSLSFTNLAPDEVAIPFLAAVYRAPLEEAHRNDYTLFLEGGSGAYKSEIIAMAQAHFGKNFERTSLPGNWRSTEPALLKQAYLVKDAIFAIDDYVPKGSASEKQALNKKADEVFRAQGNKSGRGRFGSKEKHYPRGVLLASGEESPQGRSLLGRLLVIKIKKKKGEVNLANLSELQKEAKAGALCRAMSGYIKWLAPQMDKLKDELPDRIREKSRQIAESSHQFSHTRTPDMVASIIVGGEEFLRFARENGALSQAEYEEQLIRFENSIIRAAEEQASADEYESDASMFIDLLKTAIETRRVHLADAKTEAKPQNAEKYGWSRDGSGLKPSGKRIGWISGQDIYLDPEDTYAELKRLATNQDRDFQLKLRALQKHLADEDILKTTDITQKKNTVRASIGGRRLRVLHVDASILEESDQSDQEE